MGFHIDTIYFGGPEALAKKENMAYIFIWESNNNVIMGWSIMSSHIYDISTLTHTSVERRFGCEFLTTPHHATHTCMRSISDGIG